MRMLLVADTDQDWPENIADIAAAADLVLSLGDLADYSLRRLTGHGTPVYGVYGNHCLPSYLPDAGVHSLSGDGIAAWTNLGTHTVLGISGCVRYSADQGFQWSQEEYAAVLDEMPAADWVVTHCPPRGCNDHEDHAHQGIEALTEYVVRHRPKYLFHGHTYPQTPQRWLARTRVRYVYGWRALKLSGLD